MICTLFWYDHFNFLPQAVVSTIWKSDEWKKKLNILVECVLQLSKEG